MEGDFRVKEYHFHLYWMQNCKDQVLLAEEVRQSIVSGVESGKFVVVCPGVTADTLPGLVGTNRVNTAPIGPHPAASFETWVPQEHFTAFLSHMMYNRRGLSVLIHPLGRNSYQDHTENSMWLGQKWPINADFLSRTEGDPKQYEELGLGYSKK